MRKIKCLLLVIATMLAVAMPAQAQFRWGIKAGVNVNSVNLDKVEGNFDKENRAGFTGGLTAQFTVPIIGLGVDASLMYVHRVNAYNNTSVTDNNWENSANYKNQDYLEIPLHVRYKFTIPVIDHFIAPYAFTGPNFAMLCSKKDIMAGVKNKALNTAWDFGVGVRVLNHVEIGASYAIGMSKVAEITNTTGKSVDVGKRNYWTITAAYLF